MSLFSLYIHLPFCTKKCPYCHFYVVPDKEILKTKLLDALLTECGCYQDLFMDRQLVSLYFGGGTPALFGASRIETTINGVIASCPKRKEPFETTLEVNPEDVTTEAIEAFCHAGVNRISIGVQSFDDLLLKGLGRTHSSADAEAAVLTASSAGIKNITIDLMYDLPNQTLKHWEASLRRAIALPIDQISLYNLTIEPHTAFYKKRKQLKRLSPNDKESLLMYKMAQELFIEAGLRQYDVSAFAKEGKESVHNTGYWQGRPFIGLGPSASSFWKGKRYSNIANINSYCDALKEGHSAVNFEEELGKEAALRERIAIALRLLEGVDLKSLEEEVGCELSEELWKTLHTLADQGVVELGEGRVRLTQKGVLF
ncbi:radical SAM family heme chaperone HemW, partial [Simkania negevensis]|nr:radical SAM family heme chaperone HemW [Simkania negevensis]